MNQHPELKGKGELQEFLRALNESKKGKILIVDDEPGVVESLRLILSREGYKIIKAYSGEEAIKRFESEPDIDLIIMDILMPKMDGVEAAKRIRSRLGDRFVPIVFLTATVSPAKKYEAMNYGDELLTKPVDVVELRMRIANLLKLKAYHDHLQEMLLKKTVDLQRSLAELERAHNEIKEAQSEIIYRLALAAEYKDEDTATHLKRMSHYVYIVAKALGLPEEKCEELKLSSPMHDIGKIGIPESILLKPARLTKEEFEIVKRHTVIGAKILSGSQYKLLKTAEIIALTHHENYDGRGYPLGIKGEDIPIEGRIVAIADVFDALTSKRPYKEPWELDRALNLIREESGKKFDPKVVEAFFDSLNEILKVKATYTD